MLDQLIENARLLQMTDDARQAQKRSFAYGTAHIENEAVTREMIARAEREDYDLFSR